MKLLLNRLAKFFRELLFGAPGRSARDDLEERYGMGVDSGSESSKVKATLLESVRALVMPIKSALYLHSVDGATVCRIVANISHYSFII